MKKIILVVLICLAANSLLIASENPTEESLIKAWEELQKKDPNTVAFDKIEDRRYKFKTSLLPFDGELKINDATIDDLGEGLYQNIMVGFLDVELVGLSKEFIQRYNRKYSMWARNNVLYYDKKVEKWLSPREYQSVITKTMERKTSPCSNLLSNYGIFIVLVFVIFAIVYLLYFYRKLQKTALQKQGEAIARVERSIKLSEEATQLGEETNKILKEILEGLKRKGQNL